MYKPMSGFFLLSVLWLMFGSGLCWGIPAFPGAEGFGTQTTHARGKPVFIVTRLDDLDKSQSMRYFHRFGKIGSFRWALAAAKEAGGGYIVFNTAGTIELVRRAFIPSNVYIAGQSAPGTGIAITGEKLILKNSKNVVMRHLRMRGNLPKGSDAILIEQSSENIVLDHLSVSFFRDGAVDVVGAKNITMQWSHVGDAVDSLTRERYHGTPQLLRSLTDRVSLHHNYYTHAHSRSPKFADSAQPHGLIEFSNNVIYNFRKYPSMFEARNGKGNVIGNFYIPGQNTHSGRRGPILKSKSFAIHVQDNLFIDSRKQCPGHDDTGCPGSDLDLCRGNNAHVIGTRPALSSPETSILKHNGAGESGLDTLQYAKARFSEMPQLTYFPVQQNLDEVMAKFGAWPRDNTDKRLLNEVLMCSGAWKLQLPDDHNQYAGTPRPDQDRDGMADNWEQAHGGNLSPNGHDLHPDYENIEMYLNYLHDQLMQAAQPVKAYQTITQQ